MSGLSPHRPSNHPRQRRVLPRWGERTLTALALIVLLGFLGAAYFGVARLLGRMDLPEVKSGDGLGAPGPGQPVILRVPPPSTEAPPLGADASRASARRPDGATRSTTGGSAGSEVPGEAPNPAATSGAQGAKVDSISYGTTGGKSNDLHLVITIELVDGSGKPVSGTNISIRVLLDRNRDGTYEYAPYTTRKGTTDSLGRLTITVSEAPSGCYVTEVTGVSVSSGGLVWDGKTPQNGTCK